MIYGCFTVPLCITADYTGILYYISLVAIPLGVGFFGFGMTYVNNKIKTMEDSIEDLNRKIDITTTTLWSHKRNTHREDI